MKLCWIVVLVGISIILVFLYSLVAMSSRSERFIEQLMEALEPFILRTKTIISLCVSSSRTEKLH